MIDKYIDTALTSTKITDPKITLALPHKYLSVFGMVWVSIYIINSLTAVKTFEMWGLVFSVGIITYPLVYIFADIFTEVYGYGPTRKIVWSGFASYLLITCIAYFYTLVPASSEFLGNEAFNMFFKAAPLVALTVIFANISGEFVNSFIVARLKVITSGKYEELRFILSTFLGQFVDNSLFFLGVFFVAGWYSLNSLFPLAMSSVIFCTVWEMLAIPITKRVIRWIKEKEGIDTYDHGTNFNPFKI
jgi:uncharacterized integral membrane protein (TIGR00697 family)